MITEIKYPEYAFTYKILSLAFDSGNIEIKYIPVDTRFTSFDFLIPILPNFDINNLSEYVKQWAPHDKWFAQEQILINGNKLINT